jgi:hypothetical protein
MKDCFAGDKICASELEMVREILQQLPLDVDPWGEYGFKASINQMWALFSCDEQVYKVGTVSGETQIIARWLIKKPSFSTTARGVVSSDQTNYSAISLKCTSGAGTYENWNFFLSGASI